ncbi:MAG: ABC transporter ATP-binding protein [Candidatus Hermodarchaeota archaeon]
MGMHGRRSGGPMGGLLKEKSKTRPTKQLIGMLLKYMKGLKWLLLLVSGLIILYTIGATVTPIIITDALGILDSNVPIGLETLQYLAILFIGLSFLVWVFQSINQWFMAILRSRLVHRMRTNTFEELVDADMLFHHNQQSGNITQRVIGDVEEIANGITVFTSLSSQLLLIVSTFIVLLWISWVFGAIAILAIPTAAFLTAFIGSIGKRRMLRVRQAYGQVSAKLAENLAGVAIAKSFNREQHTSAEIKELNYLSYGYMKQLIVIFMVVFPIVSVISTIMVSLVLLTGGYLSINFELIFLGTIMVQRFLMPVLHLSQYYTQLQASLAAMDRIADVLEAKPAVTNAPNAKPLEISEADASIAFENVSFEYKKDTQVLKNISFSMNPGEKVALVGHTGAGKTTVTSLLMRFYDPTQGDIFINDQNLKDITLESLHDNLSIVTQEPYLFADTVLENIRYGRPEASDEEIDDLCELIGAKKFIEALPEGFSTILQESGKSLSAGQRQMITVARTMLSDPRILILDEATSRLDAYSESLVQIAQNLLFKGRTTLVIAHRLSTIRDVDRIIVLDEGEIVEQGTHEELMENEGKYYELYKSYYAHQGVQTLDELIESSKQVQEPVEVMSTPTQSFSFGDSRLPHSFSPGDAGAPHGMSPGSRLSPKMMMERFKNMPEEMKKKILQQMPEEMRKHILQQMPEEMRKKMMDQN